MIAGRRSARRAPIALVLALGALFVLPTAAASATERLQLTDAKPGASHQLRATIRRTKYGVPHITARNVESLTAGYAYAFSQDNICTLASEYVTTRGDRSKFFGPEASWTFSGNSMTYKNLDADTYFRWVRKRRVVEKLIKRKPPIGPKAGVKKGVAGFVRGYNAYLKRVGRNHIPDRACRGAKWVRPITKMDVYRRFFQLGILASSGAAISGIATAAPVAKAKAADQEAKADRMLSDGSALQRLQPHIGSNAYALGAKATQNGRGMLLGNPHFPWNGSERLYQSQLRIPGKMDVAGGSLYGVPLVLIGHTRGLAWSHTVATAWRFTPYKLTLGADPHTYLLDGDLKQMRETEVSVPTGNGKVHRSIYSTRYGPMITNLVGIPLPWGAGSGFALRDVNFRNFRYLNHFYDNDRAQTVKQYDRIERRYQGIPWVNSLAADSKGNAYYSMQGAIPYVDDAKASTCNLGAPVFSTLGLPILDGSRTDCDWASNNDAVAKGTFPPKLVPTATRRDYFTNGNDSHWLSNPQAPLSGYDRLIGIENAERSYRTRVGLIQVKQRLAGDDNLPGKRFNLPTLEKVALGDRQYLGELWRDSLVQLCNAAPAGLLVGSGGPVDVSGACGALADWNLRDNVNSTGAILFRRFASDLLQNFTCLPTGLEGSTCLGDQTLWTTQYSNSDPVNTPRGLNIANPLVGKALADAVSDLNGAGIALDAKLGKYQYVVRRGKHIPIPGGPGGLGVFNAISAPWDPQKGFPDVVHGSSFIMAAKFQKGRCPVKADTFVTYGESANTRSAHNADYTRAFSKKHWNREAFCTGAVKRQTLSRKRLVLGK